MVAWPRQYAPAVDYAPPDNFVEMLQCSALIATDGSAIPGSTHTSGWVVAVLLGQTYVHVKFHGPTLGACQSPWAGEMEARAAVLKAAIWAKENNGGRKLVMIADNRTVVDDIKSFMLGHTKLPKFSPV